MSTDECQIVVEWSIYAGDVLFIHCANVTLSCFNLNALITSELEYLLFSHVHVSFIYSFSLLIFYWVVVSVLIFRVTYVYLPYSLAIIKLDKIIKRSVTHPDHLETNKNTSR